MAGVWDYVRFIAQQPDAVNQGLNTFKNYLQVENGIAKNFQDALTFNKNVDAMNAANANKELEQQQARQKREADALFHQDLARRLPAAHGNVAEAVGGMVGDNRSSLYANPWNAGRFLDKNHQQLMADAVARQAALDPVGAARVGANVGMAPDGNYTQAANGNVVLRTADGRTMMLPAAQVAYGLSNPTGAAQFMHQDVIGDANRAVEQQYNLDRLTHQARENRVSAAIENAMAQESAAHYNRLGYGRDGRPFAGGAVGVDGVDAKELANTTVKLMENGMTYEDAVRAASAIYLMGREPKQAGGEQAAQIGGGNFDFSGGKQGQTAGKVGQNNGATGAAQSATEAESTKQQQFDALVAPKHSLSYENRNDALAALDKQLADLDAFLNNPENQKQQDTQQYQQAKARRYTAAMQRDWLKGMSDEDYWLRQSPLHRLSSWFGRNPYQHNAPQAPKMGNIENFQF